MQNDNSEQAPSDPSVESSGHSSYTRSESATSRAYDGEDRSRNHEHDDGESIGEVPQQEEQQRADVAVRAVDARQAPPRVLTYANGELKRVNLLYNAIGCFSNSGSGLEPQIPDELFENGLTPEVVKEWAAILEDIRAIRATGCRQCGRCLLFLFLLPCLCRRECRKMRANIEEWDSAFRKWQADFNREVLEPRLECSSSHSHIATCFMTAMVNIVL
eukprot:ANDGO_03347.mRNA.1 hypothetical protein GUITHDRAFT_105829